MNNYEPKKNYLADDIIILYPCEGDIREIPYWEDPNSRHEKSKLFEVIEE